MKFCTKCGKELFDEAVVCPGCGCPVGNFQKENTRSASVTVNNEEESPGLATAASVLSFFVPILGLIFGIISVSKYKTPEYRQRGKVAIVLSIIMMVASALILTAVSGY